MISTIGDRGRDAVLAFLHRRIRQPHHRLPRLIRQIKINFHLAPPLLAKTDSQGHLIKQQFGPWMMKAFGLLAKFKSLRGSALDVFGYTAERKMERALPVDYKATVSKLLTQLNADNVAKAVAIASIPEDIRGYGHVKERHFAAAKAKEAQLLAEFNARPQAQKAA